MNWSVEITRGDNGYKLGWWEESVDAEGGQIWHEEYIEDSEEDELKSGEELLRRIQEFFSLIGSKHDAERIRVVREGREE
jgi:hypothetical protein